MDRTVRRDAYGARGFVDLERMAAAQERDRAGEHLGPLVLVAGELERAVPLQVTVDTLARDDLLHERLVPLGHAPHARGDGLAVAA